MRAQHQRWYSHGDPRWKGKRVGWVLDVKRDRVQRVGVYLWIGTHAFAIHRNFTREARP